MHIYISIAFGILFLLCGLAIIPVTIYGAIKSLYFRIKNGYWESQFGDLPIKISFFTAFSLIMALIFS